MKKNIITILKGMLLWMTAFLVFIALSSTIAVMLTLSIIILPLIYICFQVLTLKDIIKLSGYDVWYKWLNKYHYKQSNIKKL